MATDPTQLTPPAPAGTPTIAPPPEGPAYPSPTQGLKQWQTLLTEIPPQAGLA